MLQPVVIMQRPLGQAQMQRAPVLLRSVPRHPLPRFEPLRSVLEPKPDVNATAIGFESNADGRQTVAIGTRATALGNDSIAIGRDARTEETHTNSAAFGFGAITTLANQVVLGTDNVTYVLPGVTSTLSRSRQTGAIYYVTSDADGNLATTDEPVPPSGGSSVSAPSSPPASSGEVESPVATSTPPQQSPSGGQTDPALETDVSPVSIPNSSANTLAIDGPSPSTEVNPELVGSNLLTSSSSTAQTISPSNVVAATIDSQSLAQITVNSEAIEVNRQEIARNRVLIDQAFDQIGNNADDITANTLQIEDIEQGLAAVAALPDMYLNPDETWSAAGGLSTIGGEVGFGATLAIRGNENWSFGASVGMGGDETAGKVQFRYGGK